MCANLHYLSEYLKLFSVAQKSHAPSGFKITSVFHRVACQDTIMMPQISKTLIKLRLLIQGGIFCAFCYGSPSEQYCCPSLKTLKSVHHLQLWTQRESSVHGHLVCFNEHEETGFDVDHGLMITVSVFIPSLFILKASFWFRSALLFSSWSCRLYSPHELFLINTFLGTENLKLGK